MACPASSAVEADSSITTAGLLRDVRVGFYRARAALVSQALTDAQASLADSVARIASTRFRAGEISLLDGGPRSASVCLLEGMARTVRRLDRSLAG